MIINLLNKGLLHLLTFFNQKHLSKIKRTQEPKDSWPREHPVICHERHPETRSLSQTQTLIAFSCGRTMRI